MLRSIFLFIFGVLIRSLFLGSFLFLFLFLSLVLFLVKQNIQPPTINTTLTRLLEYTYAYLSILSSVVLDLLSVLNSAWRQIFTKAGAKTASSSTLPSSSQKRLRRRLVGLLSPIYSARQKLTLPCTEVILTPDPSQEGRNRVGTAEGQNKRKRSREQEEGGTEPARFEPPERTAHAQCYFFLPG